MSLLPVGTPTDLDQLSLNEDVNAFIAEQTLHLLRDVDILPCFKRSTTRGAS